MSLKKRIVAACAAVIMACSLAGCGKNTGYIMKTDGEEMASGVYISLMLTEYTNQLYTIYYSGGKLADSFEKQKIGDQLMSEYLEDYAYNTCLEIFAVEKKCEELGIELSDEEKKEINDAVNSAWDANKDYYEEMGISKDSLKRIQSFSYLTTNLFEGLYYEGGVEEVKLDEIKTYVKDNMLRYKMIYIKNDATDKEAAKKMSEKYMGYAEEGKTMDELIEMYKDETSDKKEEDKKDETSEDKKDETSEDKKEDTSTDTEEDKKDETSEGESEEGTTEEDKTEEDSEEDTSTEDEDKKEEDKDETSDDKAESDKDEEEKTPSELESEKYPNEYVRDKTGFEGDKFIEFIAGLEYKKISSYNDDNGYYIVERLDMSERTEFAEANKESLISAMKTETYETLIKSLCDAVKVEKNEKSFERYNALDVFERQDKWYEKNAE